MSRRKQAIYNWLDKKEQANSLKTRFPSITHFYRGGLFGSQPGSLREVFDIKGRGITNTVEWRGERYLVQVGIYRDPKKDPMQDFFVYAFATGADEEMSHENLLAFLTFYERKARMRPVKKVKKP